MKRFNLAMCILNWVFVTAAGILLVYEGIQRWWGEAEPMVIAPGAHPALIVGAGLLLALNILWLILRIQTSRVTTYIIFEKEGTGSLQVSVSAIEEILTKCARSLPEIADARVVLTLEKGGRMPSSAVAHCIFNEVPNLFAVQDSARQTISARYQEIFPGEQLQMEIVVDRLQPEGADLPTPPRKKRKNKGADEPSEFVGPKYPLGG